MKFLADNAMRIIAGLLVLFIIAALLGMSQCSRDKASQSRVDASQGTAAGKAGVEALNEAQRASEGRAEIDATVKQGTDDIRAAEGSDAAVSNASREATLRAACRLASYRETAQCARYR